MKAPTLFCFLLILVCQPTLTARMLTQESNPKPQTQPAKETPQSQPPKRENSLEAENDEMTPEQYFNTPLDNLRCIDHIKMMELGFSCMDSESVDPDEIGRYTPIDILGQINSHMYVISKNGEKYLMKMMDELYDLEMQLQRIFADDDFIFWFVEYKIIKGRFVGIYTYRTLKNTVRYQIEQNNLSLFQKVFILEKIVSIASDFFIYVNSTNNLIQLNLTPSNTAILRTGYLNINLINFLVKKENRNSKLLPPEYFNSKIPVNQKASCVYMLGKIVFFYLYGRYIDFEEIIDQQPEVILLNEAEFRTKEMAIELYLIQISKAMLSQNPIDRPSLEMVMSQIKKAKDLLQNPLISFKLALQEYMSEIKQEIVDEANENEDQKRHHAREKMLKSKQKKNDTEKEKKFQLSLARMEERGQKFLEYQGMASDCKIQPTLRMVNYADTFGFVPAINSVEEGDDFDESDLLDSNWENTQAQAKRNYDDPENLTQLRYEFFIIMGLALFIILIIVAYFSLKGMEMKMYQKWEFPAKIILF